MELKNTFNNKGKAMQKLARIEIQAENLKKQIQLTPANVDNADKRLFEILGMLDFCLHILKESENTFLDLTNNP